MNIAVCIKQIPSRDAKTNPRAGALLRALAGTMMNPYDKYAIEAALRLRERAGGTVTAFSMSPPAAAEVLREAFAMGVDRGCLVTDDAFAGSDAYATAYTISQAIAAQGGYDVVVCGRQTTDGDTAQVGPEIAAFLQIPFCSWVTSASIEAPSSMTVTQVLGSIVQTVRMPLPCLICVERDFGTPRIPNIRGKLASRSRQVEIITAADLPGADRKRFGQNGSTTKVHRLYPAVFDKKCSVSREAPESAAAHILVLLRKQNR